MTTTLTSPMFRLGMLVLAVLIVLHWKIGPILFQFSIPGSGKGHGMHLGDPLALVPGLLALPRGRGRLDRRVGIRTAVVPNPGRRAEDRREP